MAGDRRTHEFKNFTASHMPRQRNVTAVLEFPLPSRISRSFGIADEDDDTEETCFICAVPFCARGICPHTATHMPCCSQGLCCGCAVKVLKRCKCAEECDAVVAFCPFCREVMAVGALDVFLGTRAVCKECQATPVPEQTPSTPPQDAPDPQTGPQGEAQDPPPSPDP